MLDNKQLKYRENEIKSVKWFSLEELKNIPKDRIRGGDGFDKILDNIENNKNYPLDILDIHNYIN